MTRNCKEEVKIIRPTDFSQEAYLERRKQYKNNMERYLDDKGKNIASGNTLPQKEDIS